MTDITLARPAKVEPTDDRGWVCRTRVEHLDWRAQLSAGLVEQSPALGHIRLTRAGRERIAKDGGLCPGRIVEGLRERL